MRSMVHAWYKGVCAKDDLDEAILQSWSKRLKGVSSGGLSKQVQGLLIQRGFAQTTSHFSHDIDVGRVKVTESMLDNLLIRCPAQRLRCLEKASKGGIDISGQKS